MAVYESMIKHLKDNLSIKGVCNCIEPSIIVCVRGYNKCV